MKIELFAHGAHHSSHVLITTQINVPIKKVEVFFFLLCICFFTARVSFKTSASILSNINPCIKTSQSIWQLFQSDHQPWAQWGWSDASLVSDLNMKPPQTQAGCVTFTKNDNLCVLSVYYSNKWMDSVLLDIQPCIILFIHLNAIKNVPWLI